jgi:hypothetical protein
MSRYFIFFPSLCVPPAFLAKDISINAEANAHPGVGLP